MSTSYDFSWLGYSASQLASFLTANEKNLDSGYSYKAGQTVTYSFYTNASPPPSSFFSHVPSGQTPAFTPFTSTEQLYFKGITQYVGDIINLKFSEVSSGTGNVNIGMSNQTTGGYANYPSNGRTVLSLNATNQVGDSLTQQNKFDLWHEFGHSLGLQHPDTYSKDNVGGNLSPPLSTMVLTDMSYNLVNLWGAPKSGLNGAFNSVVMFQDYAPLDWYELASKYGTNAKSSVDYLVNVVDGRSNVDPKKMVTLQPDLKVDGSSVVLTADAANPFCLPCTTGTEVVTLNSQKGLTVNAHAGQVYISSTKNYNWQIRIGDASGVVDTNYPVGVTPAALYMVPPDGKNFFQVGRVVLPDFSNTIIDGDYFKEIVGGSKSDSFYGFSSGLKVDGGKGVDTLYLDGSSKTYKIAKISKVESVITNGTGQTMTVDNIEQIKFNSTYTPKVMVADTNNSTLTPAISHLDTSPQQPVISESSVISSSIHQGDVQLVGVNEVNASSII